tara:strand:+ start:60 stop:176 length:117 start_codon:yes stop_codon:yes gene_type:complete
MDDSLIFYTGLFCFALAILGAILTGIEYKKLKKEDKER